MGQVHRLHAPLRHLSPQLYRDVTAFLEALSAAASNALPMVSPRMSWEARRTTQYQACTDTMYA